MSVRLSASIFRLPCNQASRDATGDLLRGEGQALTFWKASSALIQGAAFIGAPSVDTLVTDWSNIVSVVLAMRAGSATGGLLFAEQVLPVASVATGLTYDNWTAGAGQHFQFLLTPAMMNVAAQETVWLVIGVNTTDSGAFPIAVNSSARIKDPGINNPGDESTPSLYTGWSKAEADGRYALIDPAQNVYVTSGFITITSGTRRVILTGAPVSNAILSLPAASAYAAGTSIEVIDPAGYTSANSFEAQRTGSDTFQGGASAVMILAGVGSVRIYSDGVSAWSLSTTTGPRQFAPTVTSVGDGAAGSLEKLPTFGLAVPALRTIYVSADDAVEHWLLVASSAATAAGIQRPSDFNSSTNAKVWFRK